MFPEGQGLFIRLTLIQYDPGLVWLKILDKWLLEQNQLPE